MKRKLTLRTIWGLAKSEELQLTDEELHLVVYANVGKDSLKELTDAEVKAVVRVLNQMKDRQRKKERGNRYSNGSEATVNQRKKIYMLEKELGWNDNKARLQGFVKKMFGVDTVEWLNYQQCSKLIEALKGMIKRGNKGLQADTKS